MEVSNEVRQKWASLDHPSNRQVVTEASRLPLPTGQNISEGMARSLNVKVVELRDLIELRRLEDGTDEVLSLKCTLGKSLAVFESLFCGSRLGICVKRLETDRICIAIPEEANDTLSDVLQALVSVSLGNEINDSTMKKLCHVQRCDEMFAKIPHSTLLSFFKSPDTIRFRYLPLERIQQSALLEMRFWKGLDHLEELTLPCHDLSTRDLQTFCANLQLPKLRRLKLIGDRSVFTDEVVSELTVRCKGLIDFAFTEAAAPVVDQVSDDSEDDYQSDSDEGFMQALQSGNPLPASSIPFANQNMRDIILSSPTQPVSSPRKTSANSLEQVAPVLQPKALPMRETAIAVLLMAFLAFQVWTTFIKNREV